MARVRAKTTVGVNPFQWLVARAAMADGGEWLQRRPREKSAVETETEREERAGTKAGRCRALSSWRGRQDTGST